MSTALNRQKLLLILATLIISIGFMPSDRKHKVTLVYLNNVLPPANTVFYYIPNSFLSAQLKTEIFKRRTEFYDTSLLEILDVQVRPVVNAAKPFTLLLRRKDSNAGDPPQARLGSISGNSGDLKVVLKNFSNQDVVLFRGNITNLAAELKGSVSYRYNGNITLTLKNKAIIASYSPLNNVLNEIITYMDSQAKFQMLGIGLVFPSQYVSSYTAQYPLELNTDGADLISKIEMSSITMRSAPNEKISTEFLIDNGTLPTQLKGKAIIDKNISLLENMYDYSYSKENLTQVEVQLMDYFASQIQQYANQKVVGMRLVPRVNGDSLIFRSGAGTELGVKMVDGRINYFKENIICSIDLDL